MSTSKPTSHPSPTSTAAPRPAFTRLLEALPASVPFVAPDALMRRTGRPIAARLGANESLFGASPAAMKAMAEALADVSFYGDPESFELREALAEAHGVSRDAIVVGSGIDDLLGLTARAFVSVGDPVVMSLGGYPTFAYSIDGVGGVLHRVPYRYDRNDLDGLAAAAHTTGAKVVYLSNPDNPSGSMHDAVAVEAFVRALPATTLLVLDEAYADFVPPSHALPTIDIAHAGVLRMRTFSKACGLAGARIGYALTAPETIRAFDKIRPHFGVNRIAQAGALAAIRDRPFVDHVVREVAAGRAEYAGLADELGFNALPSFTNFVTIDIGNARRATRLVNLLLDHGVFIRKPGAPPLDRCIRVSIGRSEDRRLFADALRAIVRTGALDEA